MFQVICFILVFQGLGIYIFQVQVFQDALDLGFRWSFYFIFQDLAYRIQGLIGIRAQSFLGLGVLQCFYGLSVSQAFLGFRVYSFGFFLFFRFRVYEIVQCRVQRLQFGGVLNGFQGLFIGLQHFRFCNVQGLAFLRVLGFGFGVLGQVIGLRVF